MIKVIKPILSVSSFDIDMSIDWHRQNKNRRSANKSGTCWNVLSHNPGTKINFEYLQCQNLVLIKSNVRNVAWLKSTTSFWSSSRRFYSFENKCGNHSMRTYKWRGIDTHILPICCDLNFKRIYYLSLFGFFSIWCRIKTLVFRLIHCDYVKSGHFWITSPFKVSRRWLIQRNVVSSAIT